MGPETRPHYYCSALPDRSKQVNRSSCAVLQHLAWSFRIPMNLRTAVDALPSRRAAGPRDACGNFGFPFDGPSDPSWDANSGV